MKEKKGDNMYATQQQHIIEFQKSVKQSKKMQENKKPKPELSDLLKEVRVKHAEKNKKYWFREWKHKMKERFKK